MTGPIDQNLKRGIYYHGLNSACDLPSLKAHGFKSDWCDEDGRWQRDGNLGVGIYLTCEWRTALWFGATMVQVTLQRGTRILDVRPPADRKTLDYLSREFGRELLTALDHRKVVPHNKHLTTAELVELVRHFYHQTWERDWGKDKDGLSRWPAKRERSAKALRSAAGALKRYGFHGYGDPESDNGIVIFAPDRIKLERVVVSMDPQTHADVIDGKELARMTLDDVAAIIKQRERAFSYRFTRTTASSRGGSEGNP